MVDPVARPVTRGGPAHHQKEGPSQTEPATPIVRRWPSSRSGPVINILWMPSLPQSDTEGESGTWAPAEDSPTKSLLAVESPSHRFVVAIPDKRLSGLA